MTERSLARRRRWRAENPVAAREMWRRERENNPEAARARTRKWKLANPDHQRTDAARKTKRNCRLKQYGLTVERYDEMLVSQGGVCAICGEPPEEKLLHVDHDHVTGKVRGLLHGSCNRALGMMRDSADLLRRAAAYIEK